jgi:DNA-binding response OmpR family regulator
MPRTILVVEDDAAARVGLLVLLANAGYRTIGAGTLKEGRDLLAQHNPDLVIVDVRLGGDNGLQLIAMAPHRIPAIVLTGFPDASLEADARHFGADFLLKPLSPPVLLDLVERKLSLASEQSAFASSRRWPRKHVGGEIDARVGDSPARIIDVGYGGVRLEVQAAREVALPASFRLTLSGNVSVDLNVVWNRRNGDTWQYGAAVNEEYQPVWRDLVDTLS